MSHFKGFGTGSNSNGQFWYGDYGFLFKKNTGTGARRSTKFAAGGNITCNSYQYIYNKYKPGTGGIGARPRSNRRALVNRATVCSDNNCFPGYNYLGQYPRYSYKSIDGYFPYPLPPQEENRI
jgi:hypothetical protein